MFYFSFKIFTSFLPLFQIIYRFFFKVYCLSVTSCAIAVLINYCNVQHLFESGAFFFCQFLFLENISSILELHKVRLLPHNWKDFHHTAMTKRRTRWKWKFRLTRALESFFFSAWDKKALLSDFASIFVNTSQLMNKNRSQKRKKQKIFGRSHNIKNYLLVLTQSRWTA